MPKGTSQVRLESNIIVESVAIVAQMTVSLPLHLPRCLGWCHADLPRSVGRPFSAANFPGHCFGPIPASGSFASSAFAVPPSDSFGSLPASADYIQLHRGDAKLLFESLNYIRLAAGRILEGILENQIQHE